MADFGAWMLGSAAGLVEQLLENFATFILGFFPDADGSILESIGSWGAMLSGYDLTFNYFYFVDTVVVTAFLDACIVMILAWAVLALIRSLLMFLDALVEAIPVIE